MQFFNRLGLLSINNLTKLNPRSSCELRYDRFLDFFFLMLETFDTLLGQFTTIYSEFVKQKKTTSYFKTFSFFFSLRTSTTISTDCLSFFIFLIDCHQKFLLIFLCYVTLPSLF
uniref:(northern house mosquito) hypothetical protein n=1 Tax=Culex pipiens TaxID=7175 RepID=A0A8D8L1D8_CULPI